MNEPTFCAAWRDARDARPVCGAVVVGVDIGHPVPHMRWHAMPRSPAFLEWLDACPPGIAETAVTVVPKRETSKFSS